ncbi:MAG: 50S ribosomal protein L7ae [Peptococcaceae bacterium]|jgi:ribosomal protein L7Ae-like RNA K-turn-binding protein|nr:50S ribosomal protein L7ae [Peptococcaceae bacterium]
MNEEKIKALLGFAQKAGKIISGDDMVISGMKKKQVFFIVLALDASAYVKKEVLHYAEKYQVPYALAFDKAELGLAIGKSPRAVLGVIDKNFAAGMQKHVYAV